MEAHTLVWIFKAFVWAFLVYNAVRLRLVKRYRLVFAMIFASMIGLVALEWLSSQIGRGSMTYAMTWVGVQLVKECITVAVLLQLHALAGKLSIRRDWHLVVVPICLVLVTVLNQKPSVWAYFVLVNSVRLVVLYLGLAVLVRTARCKRLDVGWNMKMVLLAITVPEVFAYLISVVYIMGLGLSRGAADAWGIGVGLATWVILAAGMTEYSPPIFVASPEEAQSAVISPDEPLSKAVDSR